MTEPCKNFLQTGAGPFSLDDEEQFLAQYRVARAFEIAERIRWRLNPPSFKDAKDKPVALEELRHHPFWKLYLEGKPLTIDDDDEVMLKRIEGKISRKKPITPIDVFNLEQIYCKLTPFAEQGGEAERKMRAFIIGTAEEDVAAGRFKTLEEALTHYGVNKDPEETKA
jgi:hypothetical protein